MLIYFKLFFGNFFLKSLNLTDVIGVLANNPINSFHKNAAKSEKLTSTHLWKKNLEPDNISREGFHWNI